MEQQELKELLIFMSVCAAGLSEEPKIYGPLRLIDAACRLAKILKEGGMDHPALDEFINLIGKGRESCMTDEKAFREMLQKAAMLLVDLA